MVFPFIMNPMFWLFIILILQMRPPWTFTPVDIPFEYWFENVTFRIICVMFRFSTRMSYRGVPDFVTGCLCDFLVLWNNHLLPVCWSTFWKSIWNDNGFVSLTQWRLTCSLFLLHFTYNLMLHNMIIFIFVYIIFMSQTVFLFYIVFQYSYFT